jgi:DNA mismatch repair protein MutL
VTARIRVLPRAVVDRIAAGEVVERPASVVKELIENSLDAGATRIDVEIRGGGRDLVSVRDDGCGMGADDLALAFASHATSKLADVGDLDHIASFGFRGEALASTGAVADCRIVSRERDASEGHEVECRGGEATPVRVAASAAGTLVEARQLFKYVPARRKFLRAAATESAHVGGAVQAAALANPGVGFSLTRDGVAAFRVAASDDRLERIARFHGRTLRAALLPVAAHDGSLALEGFVARPDAARPTAAGQHLFLNGRPIRDRSVQHAIRHGFEGLITRDRFPVTFLFLTMDPGEVDVNVHPAKLEVRFRDADRVHRLVAHAVRDALRAADLAPAVALAAAAQTSSLGVAHAAGVREALAEFLATPRPATSRAGGEFASADQLAGAGARPAQRYLQVRDTFLVFETGDGIAVVDQHALHERVLLEELRARVAAGTPEVQRLLVPAIVEMSATDVDLLAGEADTLARLGIAVERFGPTTLAVQSVPSLLAKRDPARILEGVAERLREGRGAGGREKLLETLLHSMACRAAVMAGDRLTESQAAELMRRADLIDTHQGCAHGRPTALRIPFTDLERRFRR